MEVNEKKIPELRCLSYPLDDRHDIDVDSAVLALADGHLITSSSVLMMITINVVNELF